jgi:hypothetical protein
MLVGLKWRLPAIAVPHSLPRRDIAGFSLWGDGYVGEIVKSETSGSEHMYVAIRKGEWNTVLVLKEERSIASSRFSEERFSTQRSVLTALHWVALDDIYTAFLKYKQFKPALSQTLPSINRWRITFPLSLSPSPMSLFRRCCSIMYPLHLSTGQRLNNRRRYNSNRRTTFHGRNR